jgi:hypothetical protein
MQMSESVALVRALRIINTNLERIERIVLKVLADENKKDGKRPKRSIPMLVMRRR